MAAAGCNMFSYCENNPVAHSDPSGFSIWDFLEEITKAIEEELSEEEGTLSVGPSTGITIGIWGLQLTGGFSIDTSGDVVLQGSYAGGITTSTGGWNGTVYTSITNAPDVDKLNGEFFNMGGSYSYKAGNVPLTGGGDFLWFEDPQTKETYTGISGAFGFGDSIGATGERGEGHLYWGSTGTWEASRFNIFDVLYSYYDFMRGGDS